MYTQYYNQTFLKMFKKKNIFFFFILFFFIIYLIFNAIYNKTQKNDLKKNLVEETPNKSNIINDVSYKTTDLDGNEYIIEALIGEIDYTTPNIIYLTNVTAIIKLKNSEIIDIKSDFGKYNSENNDTIFSKNVKINYLENAILSQYLDFSLIKNYMTISKNVVYTNSENVLKADVVEIDLKTKDSKIFMYEKNKKVNIKSKN